MQTLGALEAWLVRTQALAVIVDETGAIVCASDAACRALKYSAGELRGQNLELLIPERFRLAHIGHRLRFTDDLRTRAMGAGRDLFALCKDGSEQRVAVSLEPVRLGLQTLMLAEMQLR